MPAFDYLQCLGTPVLRGEHGEPMVLRVRKHLALLIYLAVEHRSAHPRASLVELLWPLSSSSRGRQSLATALSLLRAKLGREAIEGTRESVRLRPGALGVDVFRLEQGKLLPEPGHPPLELSAFLRDFDLPDAPGFMHWRDQQQAHWHPLVRSGLLQLIDHCRRTANSSGMERHAERLLELDGLAEEAVLARMEARALAGDRITALRVFEDWAVRAQRDLGVAPSAALEAMALRLRRRGWDRVTGTEIPPVHTDQWRGRPFVGRAREYRTLYETWEGTRKGTPSHILITGDSGVGKSTLAARLATAAGLEGASVARVQCFELEKSLPFSAITGLLVALLDRPGSAGTPPASLAELGRTISEIHRRFRNLPAPSQAHGEAARIHFAEAALDLLGAVMDEHPLILVLDDFHLADAASLAVLHFILRRVEEGPLLVVLTARPAEVDENPSASRIRQGVEYLRIEPMALEPMPPEDAEALLESLLEAEDDRPSPTQRRALLRAGGGYPMVIELLVHDWRARGAESVALAVDAMTETVAAGPPAAAYRALFERVMARLDPTAQSVLNLAAILDRRLNDLEMYRLVDVTMGQAMVSLTELARCRALRDGGDGLEFVNQAVRAQAYLAVPTTPRRLLHGQVADRLLAKDAADPGGTVSGLEIAWHCTRAGRVEEATPYLLRGAREAIRSGAPHEAESALRSGLGALARHDRAEANLLLAEVLLEQSRHGEALTVLNSADRPSRQQQPERWELLLVAARTALSGFPIPDGLQSRNWELVESATTVSNRIFAIHIASGVTPRMKQAEYRRRLRAAIENTPQEDLVTEEVAQLAFAEARCEYFEGSWERSLDLTSKALDRLEGEGIRTSLWVRLHVGQSAIYCACGAYREGLEQARFAHRVALELGNHRLAGLAASNAAICARRLGDVDGQIEWATKALKLLHDSQLVFSMLSASAVLAIGMMRRGETSTALRIIHEDIIPLTERDSHISQAAGLWCADLLGLAGQPSEGIRWSEFATSGPNSTLKDLSFAGPFARALARIGLADDKAREAAMRIEGLESTLETMDRAEVLTSQLRLTRAMGGTTEAIRCALEDVLRQLPPGTLESLERIERAYDRMHLQSRETRYLSALGPNQSLPEAAL